MTTAWLLLQLSDSGFPTGAFAHSSGLEAAVANRFVVTRAEVVRFVEDSAWQAGHLGLPFVQAAAAIGSSDSSTPHVAAPDDERRLAVLMELDRRVDAVVVSPIAHRASLVMGRAHLDTCARVFDQIRPFRLKARAAAIRGHHAPVFGLTLAHIGVSLEDIQRLYLHGCVRGTLSAAVRLGLLGPYDAQRVLHTCAALLERVRTVCSVLSVDEAAQTAPIADLLGATHDRLYARIFQS